MRILELTRQTKVVDDYDRGQVHALRHRGDEEVGDERLLYLRVPLLVEKEDVRLVAIKGVLGAAVVPHRLV